MTAVLKLFVFLLFASTFISVAIDLHWARRFHQWFMDTTEDRTRQ